MTERNPNDTLYDGFLFGIRLVFQAHHLDVPGTEHHKLYHLLREVAAGDVTLVDSTAEKMLKFPNMRPEMKEYLKRVTPRVIHKDRDTARRILDAMHRNVARQ